MKTMLETLNETIAAYKSDTRAVGVTGKCQYKTMTGLMCAVGRCMTDPGAVPPAPNSVHVLSKDGLLEGLLKPEYQGFPPTFWASLQRLHDSGLNWNLHGLSERGVNEVNLLVVTHNLGEIRRENPQENA